MFNNLDYVFDAETGELVSSRETTKKLVKKKHKKKRTPKKCYFDSVRDEIIKLEYDKNFIRESFRYCRVRLLRSILDPTNLEIQMDLDGLYLSNLLIYRKLLDDNSINLELLKMENDYLQVIKQKPISSDILKIVNTVIGFIVFYFSNEMK
jgi:hypothetical protein